MEREQRQLVMSRDKKDNREETTEISHAPITSQHLLGLLDTSFEVVLSCWGAD